MKLTIQTTRSGKRAFKVTSPALVDYTGSLSRLVIYEHRYNEKHWVYHLSVSSGLFVVALAISTNWKDGFDILLDEYKAWGGPGVTGYSRGQIKDDIDPAKNLMKAALDLNPDEIGDE